MEAADDSVNFLIPQIDSKLMRIGGKCVRCAGVQKIFHAVIFDIDGQTMLST